MATVYDFFYQLQSSGIFEFALPFLLVFTLVFAILQKTKLFGDPEKTKNVNLIISIVIALIFINQFEIVDRLNLFIPKVSLFVVVAVMFLVLIGIFGANIHSGFSGIGLFIFAILSLVIIYWALIPTTGGDIFGGGSELGFWIQDNLGWLLFLVILGIIIWAVAGQTKDKNKKSFGEKLDEIFGKNRE